MPTIKHLSPDDRPRERLEKEGATALSNAELMAILINSGTKNENALVIAQEILSNKTLSDLSGSSVKKLSKAKGIGTVKACRLIAAMELGKRVFSTPLTGNKVKNAGDAVKVVLPSLMNQKEVFIGLYLNTKNRLLKKEVISIGSLDKSVVHPRELFKPAIEESAAGIVLLHNHPSGDPTPSKEDIELTKELEQAGELLGIQIVDHIVIGKNNYCSMREDKVI